MRETYNFKEKYKQFVIILLPILVTQLGLFAMNFLDTMMSGKLSPSDLAGVAIGSSLWVPINTGLSGILLAITPIVAQLIGAKQQAKVSFSVIQGLYLSVVISTVIILAGYLSLDFILDNLNLETSVRIIAKNYLVALSFGIFPLFAYTVLRCFIDALGLTRVSMFITLLSLPINFVFNYLFIFGAFGFPKLGGIGAGVASAITYWSIFIISMFIVHKKAPFNQFKIFQSIYNVSFAAWKEILKIGVPIGFAIFFETSIFAAVTILMSTFDTITIASHQAALNFASFLYMIPLSISMALTIVVGFEIGAGRYKDARHYSYMGIAFGVLLSLFSGFVILLLRPQIAGIYTNNPDVLLLTQQFLIYAIFFQLSDAIAAPIQGALRGYKDVNVTLIIALVSYWIIGLPLGYILGNYTSFGAFGYWIGLISGLAAGAICLSARLYFIQQKYKSLRLKAS
ncbi:MATE family efflux transporter [Metabacillus arenae]|uniref:Probable multidrug resistance protein NorM n=1 Tax=Metabacillus arenae TaxID=2771434 RepID=A0A926RWC0_9BACI|nr:MATE family efflux transporter [Metabacillus arenae]MBD1379022.1 MATE family efflux transporter [Metabacillus arenae]